MANSFVCLWQELLRVVQDVSKQDPDLSSATKKSEVLTTKLNSLPPQPKSAWKRVVRDIQVPLQLGVAFCSAVREWHLAALVSSAAALRMLLSAAAAAGLIKGNAAAVGPLGVSMQQQLQQSGVLPQLAQLMASMAADLRAEAAALGNESREELCSTASTCFHLLHQVVPIISRLLPELQALWGCSTETAAANSMAWLGDASGHADAAMQLCTAALQHASSVLQHVVPAVQQRAPQLAAKLQGDSAAEAAAAVNLTSGLLRALGDQVRMHKGHKVRLAEQEVRVRQQLQQLLLSPHCLPSIASLLVLSDWYVSRDCELQARSGSQRQPGSSSSSSLLSSGGMCQHTPTPCQLKLLGLLGLSPQLAAVVELWEAPKTAGPTTQLYGLMYAGRFCFLATREAVVPQVPSTAVGSCPNHSQQQQQQWWLEQQLWGLLPSVLVPCATKLLLAAASKDPQQQCDQRMMSSGLIELTHTALLAHYHLVQDGGSHEGSGPPHPFWLEEVLGAVLQLAHQLLQHGQECTAAAPPPAPATGASQQGSKQPSAVATTPGSTGSSNHSSTVDQAQYTAEVVDLLGLLLPTSLMWLTVSSAAAGGTCSTASHQLGGSISSISRVVDAAASTEAAASPSTPQLAVAQRLVNVCATLEAGLRTVTAAVQANPVNTLSAAVMLNNCLEWLFLGRLCDAASGSGPALLLHLGLAGTEAAPAELRQLYSLLSTVPKLGHCQSAVEPGKLCFGQQTADACCWAAGETAAMLVLLARKLEGAAAAPALAPLFQARAAAFMQQPESSFLPSLVIFGRCCLVWADQLQQQAPQLLLALASSAAGADEQQGAVLPVLAEHSAAWVCVPGVEKHRGAGATRTSTPPACGLEGLVAAVSAWVGETTSPATQTALAAAAGGDSPQQLRQQLEALAAAQLAVRRGLTDASLLALVHQLRATGAMLSSVAVPHFCNDAGCVNISGPKEVGLVSGRSCLCSGCRTARYCGRACQRAAWPQHKRVCKALAAAAAAEHAAAVL